MKTLYFLMIAASCMMATPSSAQDTCRIFEIPNPHGAAMSIDRVWVADTVNFSVESVNPLPHQITATGTFDVRVCILARDGQSHSTIVRYTNTHGTSSYPVTMTAPAASSVGASADPLLMPGSVLPNPASTEVSIDPGYAPSQRMGISIVDLSGKIIVSEITPLIAAGRLRIDIGSIPNGLYLVRLSAPGRPVSSWPIVVRH